jgi:hypothetical protein
MAAFYVNIPEQRYRLECIWFSRVPQTDRNKVFRAGECFIFCSLLILDIIHSRIRSKNVDFGIERIEKSERTKARETSGTSMSAFSTKLVIKVLSMSCSS